MPEIISTLYGRPAHDPADTADDTTTTATSVAVTDEPGDTNAIDAGPTAESAADDAETTPDADAVAESAEDGSLAEDTADDSLAEDTADDADDEEPVVSEATAEDSDTDDTDDEAAEDLESAAVVAEPAPVVDETPAAASTRGTVTVGDGVAAKVVTIVLGKIDGVHGIADEGISVAVGDGDLATIKVSLVIEFGYAIKALAEQIRTEVIEAVEQFLGLDVAAVDIHVSDIHAPAAA